MTITRKSQYSGIIRSVEMNITEEQVEAYNNGALLQNAFPNLSSADREFFKSGITSEEWEDMFRVEDDE
jgi:hypothetical protein